MPPLSTNRQNSTALQASSVGGTLYSLRGFLLLGRLFDKAYYPGAIHCDGTVIFIFASILSDKDFTWGDTRGEASMFSTRMNLNYVLDFEGFKKTVKAGDAP
jgi:hypothetical protein